MTGSPAHARWSFRLLLRLYPRRYRDQFSADMAATFVESRERYFVTRWRVLNVDSCQTIPFVQDRAPAGP